ncbi:TonB-dependent receptor [Marinilabiliaceae bacterium JC017]|nr:TonB-dependent receptor [Marinilabiliaceae bacterium JC017]
MKKNLSLIILFQFIIGLFSLSGQERFSIKGSVKDTLNQPLEFVNVVIKETLQGDVTNKSGRFSLYTPKQFPITIQFSAIGFHQTELTINKESENKFLDITLFAKQEQLGEVDIKARLNDQSFEKINPELLVILPDASGGNIEGLVKTQLGVASNNELSSQYRVRGGNFDENMVYVNDIEIYRPFLVRSGQQEGLSFVNPDLVSSLNFSSGGYSAEYGDKMSSVLDIKYKRPTNFAGSAKASLLGASTHLEGSSRNNKLTFIGGVRYKTNKYLLGTLDVSGDYNPSFFDAQAFITYQLHPKWQLEALGYYSQNVYHFVPENRETVFGTISDVKKLKIYFEGQEKDLFQTGLGATGLTFSPNLQNQIKFLASGFRTYEEETYDILGQYWLQELEAVPGKEPDPDQGISNIGVGSYLEHARNDLYGIIQNIALQGKHRINSHLLSWEVKYQHECFSDYINEWEMRDSAGYSIPYTGEKIDLIYALNADLDINSNRFMSYLQDEYQLDINNGKLFLNYGLRTSYWDFNKEWLVSPRVNLQYAPAWERDIRFRLASGIYYQSPLYKELRTPEGKLNRAIKAQKSVHIVAGTDIYFSVWDRPFKFTTEAYYKHLTNLIPYQVDNVRIRYLGKNNAKGYATGLDLKINGEFVKGVESWASLSLMKTEEDILDDFYIEKDENGDEQIIHPGYIPRPSDQRLNFSLFFQDYLPSDPSFKVHLNLLYGTGLPFGPPQSERYKAVNRMPAYRRVDLGFSKELTGANKHPEGIGRSKTFKHIWLGLEVFNLFNISNTISYFWVTDINNRQYAVPNYLTSRRINLKLSASF